MNEPDVPDFLAGYIRAASRATGKTRSAIAKEMIQCYENSQDDLPSNPQAVNGSDPDATGLTGWKKAVAKILGKLPHGRWTTYGELGKAAGQNNAQAVAAFLTRSNIENAYRVLQKGGTTAKGFRWPPGVDHGNVHDWLRKDGGIRLDAQLRADPGQRLGADQLSELLRT
jgi:alkylated DNA nucleotide flippase Atl1